MTAVPDVVTASLPEMVRVPGGRFLMGSDRGRSDEAPVHEVEVEPFFLSRTPVTVAQYAAFLRTERVQPPPWWTRPAFTDPRKPVVGVTWFEAVAFTEWLSSADKERYRLPTEAEWERGARGGLEGAPTSWGASLPPGELPEGPLIAPWQVAGGTPNLYGLLDIGTIVHEWCLDWYKGDFYSSSPRANPRGPDEGERRSSRGGSWRHHVRFSAPSARSSLPPGFRYADYGFRLLRE
jgi:sulfatase modifying factor 1